MREERLKKVPGQSGSEDVNPFLRTLRLDIRVSPSERKCIEQAAAARGFRNVAQHVRVQAMFEGQGPSPAGHQKALLECAYQFNKMGNNLNQIARHLNQGGAFTEEANLVLLQILDCAEEMVRDAKKRGREDIV
jgi:hypothetical protein